MSEQNRNILTALVALSDSLSEVAENIGLPENLVIQGLNSYNTLSRSEKAKLDNAVIDYVDVQLEETEPFLKSEIDDFVTELNKADSQVDKSLRDEFHVLVANGDIQMKHLAGLEVIFGNLITLPQSTAMLESVKSGKLDLQKLIDTLTPYGDDYDFNDKEFWEVARDYFESD